MADHVLAEIRSCDGWEGMVQAFRKRVEQLGTTYEAIDEVAGLPTRYVGKLLGPARMKGFGKLSLGALMGATGIKFLVVVDEEAMAKIAGRLTPKASKRGFARGSDTNDTNGSDAGNTVGRTPSRSGRNSDGWLRRRW